MSALPVIVHPADSGIAALRQFVLSTLRSPASRRSYGWALDAFFEWWIPRGQPFEYETVEQFKSHIVDAGWSSSSINLCLSAIRKLATVGRKVKALPQDVVAGIKEVEGVKRLGTRTGNWLTLDQAQELLNTPGPTLKGLRDRSILGVLLGTAIRRAELASLTVEHIQQREGRWLILDMRGKGGRTRTIAVPWWVKSSIDCWIAAAGITEGRIFRRMRKGGLVDGDTLSADAVWGIVRNYASECGLKVSPHDLRRTCAKLARRSGADLDQLQFMLGHSDVATTQRYLGDMQRLSDGEAPNDRLGLHLVQKA